MTCFFSTSAASPSGAGYKVLPLLLLKAQITTHANVRPSTSSRYAFNYHLSRLMGYLDSTTDSTCAHTVQKQLYSAQHTGLSESQIQEMRITFKKTC